MELLKQRAKNYTSASEDSQDLANATSRLRKAEKIKAILREECALPAAARILDIGCSHGYILKSLSDDTEFCIGIDLDQNIMTQRGANIAFVRGDGEKLPFQNESFDVIVCNHVYEHTDDPRSLFNEIGRVLKPSGVCYFSGPNKYSFVEPHYELPFLSWLPRALADHYMRLTRKGERYLWKPASLTTLLRLLDDFQVCDYTEKIIADPLRYSSEDMLQPKSVKQLVALCAFRLARFFFPGFVFILRKKKT